MALLSDAQSTDTAAADRAVEEVYEVLKNLMETGSIENKSGTASVMKLYMNQEVIAIRDKYEIEIRDLAYQDIVVAIAIIVDNMTNDTGNAESEIVDKLLK